MHDEVTKPGWTEKKGDAPPGTGAPCDTCGEDTAGTAAAEVVRRGHHVLVHADTCMGDDEEIA